MASSTPDDDPDPPTRSRTFGVLISRVRNELVQGVLRILVCLARDEHGLRKVSDPQTDLFSRHRRIAGRGAIDQLFPTSPASPLPARVGLRSERFRDCIDNAFLEVGGADV
jgi:hypothetical protein